MRTATRNTYNAAQILFYRLEDNTQVRATLLIRAGFTTKRKLYSLLNNLKNRQVNNPQTFLQEKCYDS